jgi:hypothetical protein
LPCARGARQSRGFPLWYAQKQRSRPSAMQGWHHGEVTRTHQLLGFLF